MAKRQQERLKKRDELRKKNQAQKKLENYSTESNDTEDHDQENEEESDEVSDMNVSPKSPKQMSYTLGRSMSSKSLDNYKKLRQRFAARYQHQDKLSQNEKKKDKDKDNDNDNDTETNDDKIAIKQEEKQDDRRVNNTRIYEIQKEKKRRPILSKSLKMDEYKGNEEIMKLRALYKKQHRMTQKLETMREKKNSAPPKPRNIEGFLDDETRFILKEIKQCICKNTRFQGLADFGSNGNMGIELEITSNADNNGYLTGKRVIPFRGMKEINGKARIYFDLSWNGDKYVPCCKFEWIDEKNGVITKCEFDSAKNEVDLRHSFFNGKCMQYSDDKIMNEGYFDFLCVSARRREIKHNSFFNLYHTLNISEMNENELQKVPKYLRRMKDYTDKINEGLYGEHTAGDSILDGIGE